MKPFLCIDLTLDKKNTHKNGTEYLARTPNAALTRSFEQAHGKAVGMMQRAALPAPLRVLQMIFGLTALLLAVSIARALGRVTLREGYGNAPYLFWAAGICLLLWAVLTLYGTAKRRTVLGESESTQTLSAADRAFEAVYADLGVPEDAAEVDLLTFRYKVKNGKIKVCEKGLTMYENPVFRAYTDEENLYLANLEGCYVFPRSALRGVRTEKRNVALSAWNKDERIREGRFKRYGLTTDNLGRVHCRPCHYLEAAMGGETIGIYFPCYEAPVFAELTGLWPE